MPIVSTGEMANFWVIDNFLQSSIMSRQFATLLLIVLLSVAGVILVVYRQQQPAAAVVTSVKPVSLATSGENLPKKLLPPAHLAPLLDVSVPYQVRIDLLRNATIAGLSAKDVNFLYELLEKDLPLGERAESWYMLINDVMEQLRKQIADDLAGERYSAVLLGVLRNEKRSYVLRDYSIQHLMAWACPSLAPRDSSIPPSIESAGLASSIDQVQAILQEIAHVAVNESVTADQSLAGTSLMMIVNIARRNTPQNASASQPMLGPEADLTAAVKVVKPFLEKALRIDSEINTPTRVSAIQAAAVLAGKEFHPAIQALAYDERVESALRLSSIAALASCGNTDDLAKILTIAQSNPTLSYAARDAHAVLSQKLNLTH
jgi:hypothetical protein